MRYELSFLEGMALRAYGWLLRLAQPLLRWKLARRSRAEPGYGQAVPERFGRYQQAAEARSELIWVHAVSLGETRAAELLIRALRQRLPGMRLLLTHGTATGRVQGQLLLRPGDVQVWQPWDTPEATDRFLAHFRPRLGVLMETEVWPQMVAQAAKRSVPLVLANARLSERSLRKAQRWSVLARPAYGRLTAVLAQTDDDAKRLRGLGATVQAVLGNLKFDATPHAAQCELGRQRRAALARPVLMFASSRDGEELLLLQALAVLSRPWPFEVLVVPRHPQRFEAVAGLIQSHGHRLVRRSEWGEALTSWPAPAGSVWLGDTLGEMALYYSLASVALLGGSFMPLGGQNLIEAAACGCPVIMGPHTFNFSDVAEQALQEGAASRVPDMPQALNQAMLWLEQGTSRRSEQALAFTGRHRGAAQSSAAHLSHWLEQGRLAPPTVRA
jgi:3-deoxy-D-manno-octulosonic-acid transferase